MLILGILGVILLTAAAFYAGTQSVSYTKKLKKYNAIEKRALAGDKDAAYKLIDIYAQGKDRFFYPVSLEWTTKIAEEGKDSAVMLQLADMYFFGVAGWKNLELALLWYEKALERDLELGDDSIIGHEKRDSTKILIEEIKAILSDKLNR